MHPGRPRGQVLIIYVAAIFVFLGMLAVVVDVSWYWINSNRIQKAADAAALAGVVWLPGDEPKAVQTAIYEAAKNGYTVATSGVALNGVTVTAAKATGNDRRLNVTISAPVSTFFMRIFGLNSIPASRAARAEYVLPVAMGSPENYYGVFGDVRGATMTTTTTSTSTNTTTGPRTAAGPQVATQTFTGSNWSASSGTLITALNSNNNVYALTTTANALQQWGNFGLATTAAGSPIPNPITSGNPTTAINIVGLQVNLDDAFLSGTCANSTIGVQLTWEGTKATPTWSTQVKTGNLGTNTNNGDYTLGSQVDTTAWGGHPWTRSDFTDANFRIQLQALKGCGTSGIQFNVDRVRVTVYYTVSTTTVTTTTTTTTTPPADYPLHGPGSACVNGATQCYKSDTAGGGQALNPRGFWATMNTEGAGNINGDAFQPYYDHDTTVAPVCPTATLRACYDPDDYYNYAVEMPPNSSGGYVYIFDPVFCETGVASGTGDRHFSGSSGVSSFYELYDTGSSLFSRADDSLLVSSGTTFTGMDYSDPSMGGGTGGSDCRQKATSYGDARDYHDSWYLLNPSNPLTGGPTGTVYRVHTTGTNPASVAQQQGTDGEQSFAIYATGTAPGGALPKVYGLGAMQMFTPLSADSTPPDSVSTFYLAQIDPIHAGKTLELHLWDPGDTQSLVADLAVLIPTSSGWSATPFSYSAKVGTSGSGPNTACNTNSSPSTSAIRTSSGGSVGNFNGCWLTVDIPIPTTYTGAQQGWWKMQYTMHNSQAGTGTSNDVTTWTAEIQGNPVHLVVP